MYDKYKCYSCLKLFKTETGRRLIHCPLCDSINISRNSMTVGSDDESKFVKRESIPDEKFEFKNDIEFWMKIQQDSIKKHGIPY